ncbi:MAG: PUR family DNA/RNA-binding protein [Bacteroidales bacterium]|jgi:hypothetical protein|nr:PUR family DNA/RNA-binding protein [Bacteroidales bacterium]MCI2122268.1 PUR family DNA/RNA-binding protein [Bacteroidales bacterium]MCI2144649.1 PUR family DNA/RNA-binding protein [Bacteroidales bacterium]
MDFDDYDKRGSQERQGDDVYSRPVRAGKRTYFFDVKSTKGNDYYLTITESKRRIEDNGRFVYDKHKIFLYKEDFDKFAEGFQEVVNYIRENCPVPESNGYGYPERAEQGGNQENTESSKGPEDDKKETPEKSSSDKTSFTDVNFDEL